MLCRISLLSPISLVSSQLEIELYLNSTNSSYGIRDLHIVIMEYIMQYQLSVIQTQIKIFEAVWLVSFFAFVAFLSYRMLKSDICCPSKFAKIKYPMLLKYVETSSILSADTKEITPFTWELLVILTRQVQ